MEKTYNVWNENKMGIEHGVDGKSRIEIDESKVVTFGNTVRWMFGLCDRGKYDIRIFFVNDNRTRETILPIIKIMYIHHFHLLLIIKILTQIILQQGFIRIILLLIKHEILIIWVSLFIK
jgi:hypothetical protein